MRRRPLVLENFDNAYSGEGGTGRRWAAFSERTITSAEVLPARERPDIVRGKRALRLDYDFRLETTQGGSRRSYCHTYSGAENHLGLRLELADCPDTLVIPEGEYPTHLGIWLYGDGSTAWSNGCVVDANGAAEEIAYGDQDWTGWRFVTGAIPPGLKLPLYVSYPLRLLSGSKAMHGSVWLGAVMALYGGIDFDAVPPEIGEIAFDGGHVTAAVYDPDDEENGCPASGVDSARTELYIDGARHGRHISPAPEGRGFALSCEPDFPLCDGYHKAEITVYDRAGNTGRRAAFFRCGQGIAWAMPTQACLGNAIDVSVTGIDTGYDELCIEWACEGDIGPSQAQLLRIGAKDSGGALTLPLKAGFDLPGPASGGLRCLSAHYTKGGEAFAFCLPDLAVELTAGLRLVMRHFSKGLDAEFAVTDRNNRPMPGARIRCDGNYLEGATGDGGLLAAPGLTDGALGRKIEAFASCGGDYSYTQSVHISRDFAQPLPANVTLTLRAPGEVGVTWQCGAGVDDGCVQYAERGGGKTSLDDGDETITAEVSPHYTALFGQYTELSAFRAVLGGLEPDRAYLYRVGGPSGWSPAYSFKTPADGPAVTFAVLADTHNVCGGAMASALRRCPGLDFFLHAGDYVGSGGAYDNWLALQEDSRGLLPRSLMLPVVGNHDTMDGNGAHYRMVFNSPHNGPPGARGGMTYSCEIGDALFIALGDGESESATALWAREVLSRSDKKWKILFLHSGPYTCWINSEEYERKLGALAQQLGFHLVLSGHDHVYHRATIRGHATQPVTSTIRAGQGVTYVQCGSSGNAANDEEAHRPIWNKVHETKRPVYALITVTREKINIKGIELPQAQPEGAVFDDVDIVFSD
ncbi:MAG: metallophosphoesterase family protein [Oscillospiraceae bacterium]|jgi:predicted phosphodiesterase|nr:metallophosphoesterase family protein [Oscillospiraceae bacterium]